MSIDTVVAIFLFLLIVGAIFACMFGITYLTAKTFPVTAYWMSILRYILMVLLLLAVIFYLLDLSGHPVIDFHPRR